MLQTSQGPGRYELQVADSDGFNPQSALVSREPIISPAWSPDGTRLAYVSFEARKPVSWYAITAEGKRALKRHLAAMESLIKSVNGD